ncbi:DUF6507 family protein [Spelaeicoccus albus]|uniref:Excreted virulence factor EspC (Type VII ESX diderm) n=1 Tax=Spelaeicoccus albus TaxID=1280376 RepID=A0A7Z0D1S8_9MICO|nr:DUF6507 family protein [Spelaeicoccus albus]NYI66807.1 hypothetical protein [Spelaeicoccus albus]
MTSWDIDVPGVSGVLKKVSGLAEDYESQVKKLQTHLKGAAVACKGGPVPARLQGLAEDELVPAVKDVAGRTKNALTGTSDAVKAYVRGDLDMAANAQQNAGKAPTPQPPGHK